MTKEMVETTTAVYLTYTSGVATTSWAKSVPSH
jgi:hypothetical protein